MLFGRTDHQFRRMWPSQLDALVQGHQRFNGIDQQKARRSVLAGLLAEKERRKKTDGRARSQSQNLG